MVGGVNDAPVVDNEIPDRTDLDSDNINLDIAGNFSDQEGDTLTFSATGLPLGLSINAAGVISGTLDSSASQNGPYTVVVTVDDGNGGTVTDEFIWTVVNPAPVADDDSFTTDEDTAFSGTVVNNDNDADGDALLYSQTSNPTSGSVVLSNDGSFVYTPNANFNGTDTFNYEVTDADGATSTATVTIVVDAENDAPVVDVAIPDQTDTDGDVINLDVSGNISDADGDSLTFTATGLPLGLSIDAAGNITGTLDTSASQGSPYTVTVMAEDGNGGIVLESFMWNVNNPAPISLDDGFTTNEDTAVNDSVAGNDSDADDTFSFNQLTDPTNGSVVFGSDGSFTYTPNADFSGTDTFDYEIVDADGASSVSTVTITISSVNDAPVVDSNIDDQTNLDSDTVSVDVSSHFSDIEGDTLTFTANGLPPGLMIDSVTGEITGTLDADASQPGTYSVSVIANDGNGGSVTETFVWTVTNPVPVALDDNFATDEDVSFSGSVTGNDSDADADTLVYNQTSDPANGTVVWSNDGTFVYTPNSDFAGTDTFTYELVDSDGAVSQAVVTIVVAEINDAPVVDTALPDRSNFDSDNVSIDISSNFSDIDGDILTYSVTGLPTGLAIDSATGLITGTIDSSASQNGPYTVSVTVDDGNGGTVTESFTWSVANPAPNAVNDAVTTTEDTAVSGDASTNDSDPDSDTVVYNQLTNPTNGSLVWNNDGTFTYTPNTNFTGIDSFNYETVDADGASSVATVTISVGNVNDPPTIDSPIADQTNLDSDAINLDVSGNFSDLEGDSLSFTATGLPPGLVIDSAGNITGTLDSSASQGGPYVVVVTADDGNGGTVTDSFNWTVNNPGPVASDNANSVTEDSQLVASGDVLTDDDDPDSDVLNVTQVNGQAAGTIVNGVYGSLQVNADGTYTYTLDNTHPDVQALDIGESLSEAFTYDISDGEGGTASAMLNITIDGTNDAPIPSNIPNQTNLDTDSPTLDLSNFFDDVDDTSLTYSVTGLPTGLSIDTATGIVSGTLDGSASQGGPATDGVYTVFVTAQDDNGEFVVSSFEWTVDNPGPVANDDQFTTNEDTAVSGSVTGNDNDPDGDSVTYAQTSTPTSGSVVFNNDGTFTYTPNANFHGSDSFDYELVDADGATSTATVTIDIASINDAPTVNSLADQTDVDSDNISINVGNSFSDLEGDTLTFTATGLPLGLSIDPGTGVISGTLESSASQNGPYTIVVTADDGNGGTVSDSFDWNISNPAPDAVDDNFTTDEDTPVSGTVASNDSDPDGDALTFSVANQPTNGNVVLQPNGSFTYTPDPGYNGPDSFDYQTVDADGATSTATAFINIDAVNDVPVVDTPIADQTNLDSETVSVDVGSGFSDPDGDALTFSAAGLPTGLSIDPVTGLITGTLGSSASQSGPYTIVVTAEDGNGGLISDTFEWTVTNPGPVAVNDGFVTSEDTPVSGSVTGNDSDPDGDTATYNQTSSPINGSVVFNSDGSFTYTPNTNFAGIDSFTYEIEDADGATAVATVSINVGGLNDAPVSTPLPAQTNIDGDNINIDVSSNFNDPDGDLLTYTANNLPPGLSIDPNTGMITGTLDSSASQGGPYTVTVTADDGFGETVSESFEWQVTNPGPQAGNDNFTTDEDVTVNGDVAGNDSDPDNDTLTFNVTSEPNFGALTLNPDGTFAYTPNADFAGTDTFTYEVVDADGDVAPATVTIVVAAINDAPQPSTPLEDLDHEDNEPVNIDLGTLFDDAEGDTLTFTVTGLPPGLAIDPNTGIVSGTIDQSASQNGPYTVTLTVDDGVGGTTTETFVWNVVNPAPVAVDDMASTDEDTPVSSTVANNDVDPDGDAVAFAVVTQPANGTVTLSPDGSYTYTPNPGFSGTDSFAYSITDADGAVSRAVVKINVEAELDGILDIFSFDAFRNEAEGTRLVDRFAFESREILLSQRIDLLAKEPIIAGSAAPGTILVARLYTSDGSMIGEVTSTADQAGNWVINFAGTPETRNARVVIEQIATEAVALGDANLRLTDDTYRSLQLEANQQKATTAGSILSDLPSNVLEQLHKHHNNPLDLL